MHELKEKLKSIGELKEQLTALAKAEMAKGAENVCTEEMGEVVDMIKDLAEVEEKCWKAKYYCKIIEAMEKAKEEEELMAKVMKLDLDKASLEEMRSMMGNMRMGYDRWRRADGEYAPKGEGTYTGGRMGFMPMPIDREPWEYPWDQPWNQPHMRRMGYPNAMSGSSSSSNNPNSSSRSGGSKGGSSGRPGYDGDQMNQGQMQPMTARDRYADARRYFSETGSPESRERMSQEAKECLQESVETMRDIWVDADPEMQEKMKRDLLNLMREMGM